MDRRSFLKLAAASPALVSPVYAGCSDGNAEGYASGTVIGSQSLDPQTGFTFYSPLAEAWYRSGEYFEWTSTTPNNEGRRVRVFYRTFDTTLVSPVYLDVQMAKGYASGTVIGSQSLDPQTGFTFYSPLAEAWYRSGEYFEWTSTTSTSFGR